MSRRPNLQHICQNLTNLFKSKDFRKETRRAGASFLHRIKKTVGSESFAVTKPLQQTGRCCSYDYVHRTKNIQFQFRLVFCSQSSLLFFLPSNVTLIFTFFPSNLYCLFQLNDVQMLFNTLLLHPLNQKTNTHTLIRVY